MIKYTYINKLIVYTIKFKFQRNCFFSLPNFLRKIKLTIEEKARHICPGPFSKLLLKLTKEG